ncbi:MAG: DNA-directed RNA polymerase subunit omega [Syntrophomonadaceae bacterium]|jgi:DNA-directed RNA polymerase subunit omega|nr:DNA-directed RNA polymerase subunit omega [Syntrophomonadaceae bacterium]
MIPPSTRELIKIADSKYAVVVAVAKRARSLSEKNKDEDYRLSTMVTEALEDILGGKVKIN